MRSKNVFTKILLMNILIFSVVGVAQVKVKNPYVGTRFGSDWIYDGIVSSSIERLRNLGYSDSIINILVKNRLDILAEMANLSDAQLKPVTLYRGIAAAPRDYDPLFLQRVHLNGYWRCLALNLGSAMGWGSPVDAPLGHVNSPERVVLEFKYPTYMLYVLGIGRGDDETRVDTHKLPDDRIFLNRFGIYRLGQSPHQVKWYNYESIFNGDGKFIAPKRSE